MRAHQRPCLEAAFYLASDLLHKWVNARRLVWRGLDGRMNDDVHPSGVGPERGLSVDETAAVDGDRKDRNPRSQRDLEAALLEFLKPPVITPPALGENHHAGPVPEPLGCQAQGSDGLLARPPCHGDVAHAHEGKAEEGNAPDFVLEYPA